MLNFDLDKMKDEGKIKDDRIIIGIKVDARFGGGTNGLFHRVNEFERPLLNSKF